MERPGKEIRGRGYGYRSSGIGRVEGYVSRSIKCSYYFETDLFIMHLILLVLRLTFNSRLHLETRYALPSSPLLVLRVKTLCWDRKAAGLITELTFREETSPSYLEQV